MARERMTLPDDFEEMLEAASIDELKAVFETREIDARGGYTRATAIGFTNCPDELVVWLVERGLSPDEPDSRGVTPLMARATRRWRSRADQIPLLRSLGARADDLDVVVREAACSFNVEAVRVLLAEGASVDAVEATSSPLFLALRITENKDITETARIAELLLANGARVTPETREQVQRIGKRFEHYRDVFAKDSLDETDAALNELYRLFDVEPVPQLVRHDGVSPIVVPDGEWFEQHEALWEFLVPGMDAAEITQGEVIRLTGKLAREILDNGGINWNRNFRKMLKAVPTYFDLGNSLPASELREAASIARRGWRGRLSREQVYRLEQLAVEWVQRNPEPIALPRPTYKY